MPELPEVETLCRQLRERIVGRRIVSADVLDRKLPDIGAAIGKKIVGIDRYGKWLTLSLSGRLFLQFHLRMTGRIFYVSDPVGYSKHTRLILGVGEGYLLLDDPRRFATVTLQRTNPELLRNAPDALRAISPEALRIRARSKRVAIKTFLLDQRILCGIGNIYACEILFTAAIDPRRRAASLSLDEWCRIGKAIPAVLERAVSCRGTSISDWRDLFAEKAEFQNHLQVYQRNGLECPRCGATIERTLQNGRGSFFCPRCQK